MFPDLYPAFKWQPPDSSVDYVSKQSTLKSEDCPKVEEF